MVHVSGFLYSFLFYDSVYWKSRGDHFYFGVNMAWDVNAVDENRSSETEDTISFLGLTEIMG